MKTWYIKLLIGSNILSKLIVFIVHQYGVCLKYYSRPKTVFFSKPRSMIIWTSFCTIKTNITFLRSNGYTISAVFKSSTTRVDYDSPMKDLGFPYIESYTMDAKKCNKIDRTTVIRSFHEMIKFWDQMCQPNFTLRMFHFYFYASASDILHHF